MGKPAKGSKKDVGFTAEEKAAMKERAKELKEAASKEEAESAVLEKISEMPEAERTIAKRLHEIIKANAPDLMPKTWYGMPAYYKDGAVLCFYQSAQKFGTRYGTFNFTDKANLDEGALYPIGYALKELNATEEKKIVALVKQAVSGA